MEESLRAIAERNRSSRERLRAIASALPDSGTIDNPWTAAALFAHMAFWDRFVFERWRLAAEKGDPTPVPEDNAVMDRINDASLKQWLAIPARLAVEDFLDAAAELEELIARLDATIVSELVGEGRERLIDRSLQRGDTSQRSRKRSPRPDSPLSRRAAAPLSLGRCRDGRPRPGAHAPGNSRPGRRRRRRIGGGHRCSRSPR